MHGSCTQGDGVGLSLCQMWPGFSPASEQHVPVVRVPCQISFHARKEGKLLMINCAIGENMQLSNLLRVDHCPFFPRWKCSQREGAALPPGTTRPCSARSRGCETPQGPGTGGKPARVQAAFSQLPAHCFGLMSEAVPCLHCKTFPVRVDPCPRCAAPAVAAGRALPAPPRAAASCRR